MTSLIYTVFPVVAVLVGAVLAVSRRPPDTVISGVQHLAAGVVFAAAATEILPQVKHQGSLAATFIGGSLAVILMLGLKSLEERWKGPSGMAAIITIDIFIDGMVLGLAFLAGEKAGVLLTVALTLEVLFLGLTATLELAETIRPPAKVVAIVTGMALTLPLGVLAATPVALASPVVITGFLSFGLIALLYLVTEELLVEAHEMPDSPLISAMFFVGFLGLLLIEEAVG